MTNMIGDHPPDRVQVDQDREAAFDAGFEDSQTGTTRQLAYFLIIGLGDDYRQGHNYGQAEIREGRVSVDQVMAAAGAVHGVEVERVGRRYQARHRKQATA